MLLLISNIPIILIHNLIFSSRHETMSEMLFINFIGPEPKSLTKVLTVDVIVMLLQAVLLQCKWDATSFRALSALPVPASDSLEPLTSYLSQRTSDPTPRDDTNVPPVE